jgi:membrane fusion protein, macrolide-specific efflux system
MNNFIKIRDRFIPLIRSLSATLLTVAFTITLSGCFLLPEDEEVMAPPVVLKEPVVKEIVTEKVRRGNIENKLKFWGTFLPSDQSDLFFTDMGRLESVNVAYGDRVQEGDILAKLESDDLDIQLAQLEISHQKAKLIYDHWKEKNEASGGIYKYELEDAKLSMDSVEISIASVKDKLSKVSIISPISGIVTYINPIKPGQMITVRTTFITVCDTKNMALAVKEGQVKDSLQIGTQVSVNYNGKLYHGEVIRTPEENMNEKNANLKSTYTIDVEGLDINFINLNDTASIEYVLQKADNVLIIDKSYIRVANDKNYVNVYKDGVIEEREVVTGTESDNGIDVEITEGLSDTDELLVQ